MDISATSNSLHELVKVMEDSVKAPSSPQHSMLTATSLAAASHMEGKKKRKLKKCIVHACTSGARSRGLCKAHGGGKRCGTDGCNLSDQGGGYCIRHGGGKRCEHDGCDKSAQSKRFCKAHGGGVRCDVAGCVKSSQGGGKCRAHGGGPKWMRGLSSSGSDDDRSSIAGSETPPPTTHAAASSSFNPRLSLSVIDKIKSKSARASLATLSPLRKDLPVLKTPVDSLPHRFTLPPLSSLHDKYLDSKSKMDAACIYPKCGRDPARMGFCAFHSAQFCCQVAGCNDKPLRSAAFCASHHASATLAKCLLRLTSETA
ncbi:Aste57867_393 [Aphanomyces stellatus]|uniref:Aste57867_393 protein n=1 Tax=Aphanomyces stellatus TaxID=120398 RepID=A0A485K7P2_9STRA|nr:hypothetical protein As57867_000392 [Aphanomyces stellatus]VFT77618.1 Aste57867_393 [Aphanomyces stellatus]